MADNRSSGYKFINYYKQTKCQLICKIIPGIKDPELLIPIVLSEIFTNLPEKKSFREQYRSRSLNFVYSSFTN